MLFVGCSSSGLERKAGQTPGPVYWALCHPPGRIGVGGAQAGDIDTEQVGVAFKMTHVISVAPAF